MRFRAAVAEVVAVGQKPRRLVRKRGQFASVAVWNEHAGHRRIHDALLAGRTDPNGFREGAGR